MYTATIRHHSISDARTLQGASLTDAKRKGTRAFGDSFIDYEIIVIDDRTGDVVARRRVSDKRWTDVA